jgi:fibro-slime domain-containing protein
MNGKTFIRLGVLLSLSLCFFVFTAQPQTYPQTIHIPVTFYDFHADGSNPEFERPGAGLVNGEVADTLDSERKPVVGPRPYYSQYVHTWFRPWQPGDFTIPIYSASGSFVGDSTVEYDTAFKNNVFPDSLPFTYVAGSAGMYQYTNPNFFMLDGRGFGADDPGGQNPPHNFGFTMELHWSFTYASGLRFDFEGDDDVWVFINGRKVIDLGGIHGATPGSIDLDTLTGMTAGKTYSFDIFYAERHVVASDIKITTNLFTPPGYMKLYPKPGAPGPDNPPMDPKDTITAGQTFSVYAHVFDNLQVWQQKSDSLVTWTLTDTMGNPLLTNTQGAGTAFTPREAYGNAVITASFNDPVTGTTLTTSINVFIGPGPAHHIVIEADSLARNTRDNEPVSVITVNRTVTVTVYAVVRDTFGNFVRFATNASWSVRDPGIASATPQAGVAWSAAVAENSYGTTELTASEPGLIPGTATITTASLFTPPGYLRLYSSADTLSANLLGIRDTAIAGTSFPIYAHVFDSLNNWQQNNDDMVTWTLIDTMGNPQLTANQGAGTAFTPREAYGNAVITASFTDPVTGKTLTASINVFIGPGPAHHIVIEADSLARNTRDNEPVPTITVDRTVTVTVYAVVRDTFGNFVRFATNALWSVRDPGIASATPHAASAWSAVVAGISSGTTELTASEPGLIPGSATITATGPVPVTAILFDNDGDGHLDRVDLVLPDSVSLAAVLPAVKQLIVSMDIVSDDGGRSVTLVADTGTSLTKEGTRIVHVTLRENFSGTLETGWSQSSILLSDVPMTSDGRPMYVTAVVDSAEPVVKSICFVPMPSADTLNIVFSEPAGKAAPPLDEYTIISITDNKGAVVPLTGASSRLKTVNKQGDGFLYVFQPNTFTGLDSLKAGTRSFPVELCGDVSVVVKSRAINNPFIPGQSILPVSLRPNNEPQSGMRIEVQLMRAIASDLKTGKVKVSFSIFDAVGNTIVEKTDMKEDLGTDSLTAYFDWQGKTKKGAAAAPGTYLVRGVVDDQVRGRKTPFRFYIGIKR